jgi:hypothetical protein
VELPANALQGLTSKILEQPQIASVFSAHLGSIALTITQTFRAAQLAIIAQVGSMTRLKRFNALQETIAQQGA